jgi:hypothetical protein
MKERLCHILDFMMLWDELSAFWKFSGFLGWIIRSDCLVNFILSQLSPFVVKKTKLS